MAKSTQNKTASSKADAVSGMMWRMLYGNVITSEFFARHWLKLFILVVLVMIFISNKYQCMTHMEEIKRLETELSVTKTEGIRQRSSYMSRTRESSMQNLVDSTMPGLGVQKQPPYRLRLTEN